MGIYDRDYSQDRYHQRPHMQFIMPSLTPAVKWLLITNVVVFVLELVPAIRNMFELWLSVFPGNLWMALQPWRPITYQFLHGGPLHLFFNMLILYFFGPMLERLWGTKRFAIFYLVCGAMGGIVYPILVGLKMLGPLPLVGASGAIYGMLGAGAIMFPTMRVYVFGVFPLPFSVLAIILVIFSLFGFMGGQNAGGEAAHLAGMAAGAAYVLWRPWVQQTQMRFQQSKWEKKVGEQKDFQGEVDRILEKVHTQGLHSLTRRERKTLQQATQREQHANRY